MYQIEYLDHRTHAVAQRIHEVLVLAHAQEVDVIQAGKPMPAGRAVSEIQASSEHFLGAVIDGKLIGAVSVGPDDEPGQINVASLIVHPDHQRRGVAQSLMLKALELGNGAAFSVVTASANAPALALYASLGFVEYRRGISVAEQIEMVKLRRERSGP